MCKARQITKKSKKGIDINLLCSTTGLPIVESNQFGTYCVKKCGLSEDKKVKTKVENFIKLLMGPE